MDPSTSTQAPLAAATQFECAICAHDQNEVPKIIDSNKHCRECVGEIVKMFHAAAKHEFKYPVEYRAGVTLKPEDFKDYFEDYETFVKQWRKAEQLYSTPAKERLYCHWDHFLGKTTTSHERVFCPKCVRNVCGACGCHKVGHQCVEEGEIEDPFQDTTGCYKRCPNEKCASILTLADGCNELSCGVCKTRFCWICRKIDSAHSHWNMGNPCPRFNAPGAANALYNEDVIEVDNVERPVGQLHIMNFDIHALRHVPRISQLPQGESRLEEVLRATDGWGGRRTVDGTYTGMNILWQYREDRQREAQILREHNARFRLQASPQGRVMLRHRDMLSRMRSSAIMHEEMILGSGRNRPSWITPFITITRLLLMNVELYIYREHIKTGFREYNNRHTQIAFMAEQVNVPGMLNMFPDFFVVFSVYQAIAPRRLTDAYRALPQTEREALG